MDKPQSLNLYTYCLNNPVRFTDPTGMVVNWDDSKKTQKKGETTARSNLERKFHNYVDKLLRSKDAADVAKGQKLQAQYNRLDAAQETFHVVKDKASDASAGELEYRGQPGNLYICMKGNAGSYGALSDIQKLIHEFTHGEQFLDRKLGFFQSGLSYQYDLTDEAEAFIAGFEVEPLSPAQKGNSFLNGLSQQIPFGLTNVVNYLGGSKSPYQRMVRGPNNVPTTIPSNSPVGIYAH